jgi:hypothetical protein
MISNIIIKILTRSKFEDTKRVISNRKPNTDNKKSKRKRTNNDLQNIEQKTID